MTWLHPFHLAGASLCGQHTGSLTPVILCKLGVVLHLAADALGPVHHVLDAGACTRAGGSASCYQQFFVQLRPLKTFLRAACLWHSTAQQEV